MSYESSTRRAERRSASSESGPENGQRQSFMVRGPRFVREKLQGKMFVIPSFVTVTATFCGFLALMSALKGTAEGFEYATKCIALAIILDGLDGRVARRLNATSDFGREFDSLSDVVAFGVAPAVLVYCWALRTTADEIGILVGFLYVVCGAMRLARFNVMTVEDPKPHFTGLPIPGAAAAVAAVVYSYPAPIEHWAAAGAVSIYTLLLAFLMISTIPFISVKKVKLTQENQWMALLGLAALVALSWKYSRAVVLIGSVGYALSGPLLYLLRRRRGASPTEGPKAQGDPTEPFTL